MKPRLTVDAVTVQFAGLKAVSDVSFDVAPGEICGIIGPNGAGKSTLFNAIGGYVKVTSGQVHLDGRSLTGQSVHEIAAAGVRRTFQNGGLFQDMTVLENVMVGLHHTHFIPLVPAAVLWPSARKRERETIRAAQEMLEIMGISELQDTVLRDLSSGQQRMVEIVRALAVPAKLLMLDEPAVGLTAREIERLDEVLRELAGRGISVLLVEHVLDLLMSVSDKVLVLNSGERLAEGEPEAIRQDPAVLEAYLGYS